MWQAICEQLSDTLMFSYQIIEKEKLNGGDISDCYMISDGNQRYFVKINRILEKNSLNILIQAVLKLDLF